MIEFLTSIQKFSLTFHILGVALGLGGAIVTDFLFLRFLKDNRVSPEEKETLDGLSLVIWGGIALLVVSGVALFLPAQERLLNSPAFMVKVIAVVVVIVNACFLNFYVAPKLTSIDFLNPSSNSPSVNATRRLAPIFGGISITSWLFIFFLASLKRIFVFSFYQYLWAYLVLLAAGIVFVSIVTKLKFRIKK